jgi:hypothetical protein
LERKMVDANQLSALLMQGGQDKTTQNQLNQRAQLAQMLMQSGQKASNPIIAALTGFLGTNELQNIADQQGNVDRAQAEREAAKEAYKIDLGERQFSMQQEQMAEQQRQFNEQMKQTAQQFSAKIGLERDKFNLEALRDAQNNAITKVQDPKTGVDMLFKGMNPLNDGLEKGLQWGIDRDGNRVAVPIAVAPNERAATQKQLALETVTRLLQNKSGVKSVYGAVDRITPNISEESRNAETDINALRAMLTLDNLELLKGAMSDNDIKFIQNVSAGSLSLDTADQGGALKALEGMKYTLEGRSFASEQEAEAAKLPKGTKILVGGKMAVVD